MYSAEENPHVVEEYLEVELAHGVLLSPFRLEEVTGVHLNFWGDPQIEPAREMAADS